jgi:GNAT superfamily N-acetyltransferase
MITFRVAKNEDCEVMYNVHANSIKYYCSDFYSQESIAAWIELKKPEDYANNSSNIYIVVQEDDEIVGLGLLNINKKSIDSLYLKPQMAKRGIGAKLLLQLEELARKNNINELKLSATLNSTAFYHRMGYIGDMLSSHRLSSGIALDCVEMTKKLM